MPSSSASLKKARVCRFIVVTGNSNYELYIFSDRIGGRRNKFLFQFSYFNLFPFCLKIDGT